MDRRFPLKKSKVHIHVTWSSSFSNNLCAENIQYRFVDDFEICLDLNCNLRKRNKQTNTYIDASELAKGDIHELELIQFSDRTVAKGIIAVLNASNKDPNKWVLKILLDGEYSFIVKPLIRQIGSSYNINLEVQSTE